MRARSKRLVRGMRIRMGRGRRNSEDRNLPEEWRVDMRQRCGSNTKRCPLCSTLTSAHKTVEKNEKGNGGYPGQNNNNKSEHRCPQLQSPEQRAFCDRAHQEACFHLNPVGLIGVFLTLVVQSRHDRFERSTISRSLSGGRSWRNPVIL